MRMRYVFGALEKVAAPDLTTDGPQRADIMLECSERSGRELEKYRECPLNRREGARMSTDGDRCLRGESMLFAAFRPQTTKDGASQDPEAAPRWHDGLRNHSLRLAKPRKNGSF